MTRRGRSIEMTVKTRKSRVFAADPVYKMMFIEKMDWISCGDDDE